jgi:hypothetical protein
MFCVDIFLQKWRLWRHLSYIQVSPVHHQK